VYTHHKITYDTRNLQNVTAYRERRTQGYGQAFEPLRPLVSEKFWRKSKLQNWVTLNAPLTSPSPFSWVLPQRRRAIARRTPFGQLASHGWAAIPPLPSPFTSFPFSSWINETWSRSGSPFHPAQPTCARGPDAEPSRASARAPRETYHPWTNFRFNRKSRRLQS